MEQILAARAKQLKTANLSTQLHALRANSAVDSDDDDDDDQPEVQEASSGSGVVVERSVNLLSDPNVGKRQVALAQLLAAPLTAEQSRSLLQPLLLRFSDTSERCRECAVTLFTRWADAADSTAEVAGSLPFLMPVLVERLGSTEEVEPCEEIRAALASLTSSLLLRCRQLLRPYLSDIGAICLGCCRDRNPETVKNACRLLVAVADEVLQPLVKREGGKAVKPFADKLVEAVLPQVRHRHAAVRLEAIAALEAVLLCGAGQSVETVVGWRLQNNVPIKEFYGKGEARINYLADLSRDRSLAVRRRMVRCMARWIRDMDGSDLYEQEVRLMPFLLSGLFDEDASLREEALALVESAGRDYLVQNEPEFREKIDYGHADEAAAAAAITLPLPHPFTGRPSVGARARVRNHFRAIIYPIMAELQSWTGTERLQAAQLLEVLLVFIEAHATEFGHQLMPALAKATDAENAPLAAQAARCTSRVAGYVEPSSYMPLVIGQLRQDALNMLSQRTDYFALVPHLLRGARAPHLIGSQVLGQLLDDQAACVQHTPLRAATRALLLALCELGPPAGAEAATEAAAEAAVREEGPSAAGAGAHVRGRDVLVALLQWHGSEPLLQKQAAERLSESLEEIEEVAEGPEWQAAVRALEADLALLAAGWGQALPELLSIHAHALDAALQRCEGAPHALRMLHELLGDGAPARPPTRARAEASPPSAARSAAAATAAVAPKKILVIEEEDDDEDDGGDEEEVKIRCTRLGGGSEPTGAKGGMEEVEEEIEIRRGLASGPTAAEGPEEDEEEEVEIRLGGGLGPSVAEGPQEEDEEEDEEEVPIRLGAQLDRAAVIASNSEELD